MDLTKLQKLQFIDFCINPSFSDDGSRMVDISSIKKTVESLLACLLFRLGSQLALTATSRNKFYHRYQLASLEARMSKWECDQATEQLNPSGKRLPTQKTYEDQARQFFSLITKRGTGEGIIALIGAVKPHLDSSARLGDLTRAKALLSLEPNMEEIHAVKIALRELRSSLRGLGLLTNSSAVDKAEHNLSLAIDKLLPQSTAAN